MKDNGKTMVLASFVADSLALGVHWIYDTEQIEKDFGRVDTLLKPASDSFHPSKDKGEFTHYGDQAFVLLQSIAAKKGFDLDDFSTRWRDLFNDYDGYYDHATRDTLENFADGKSPEEAGSSSGDLSGASRVAPIVFCYRKDLKALVDAARAQTRMTHNHPLVVDSGEFFARVAWLVLGGMSPVPAMQEVANQVFENSPISGWVKEGIESLGRESVSAIRLFGQSCSHDEGFKGVVHLIAKYPDNLKEALIKSVMAGGDSAARGMIVGMILAAQLDVESLPENWRSGLKRESEILTLLNRIR